MPLITTDDGITREVDALMAEYLSLPPKQVEYFSPPASEGIFIVRKPEPKALPVVEAEPDPGPRKAGIVWLTPELIKRFRKSSSKLHR